MEKSRKLIPAGKKYMRAGNFFPFYTTLSFLPKMLCLQTFYFLKRRSSARVNENKWPRKQGVIFGEKKEKKSLLTDYPEDPNFIFRSSFLASEQAVTRKTMYIEVIWALFLRRLLQLYMEARWSSG